MKLRDKILLGVYLIGEALDVITTIVFLRLGYQEINPLIKTQLDMLVSAVITTSIIVFIAWKFKRIRCPFLITCNIIKWFLVVNNTLLITTGFSIISTIINLSQ
jgi:hypothetical protein